VERDNIRVVSSLKESDESFDVSDRRVMSALHAAEDEHFWHRTRNEWIAARLKHLGLGPGAAIVELGCGGGCVTAHLCKVGYRVVGVDGHRGLLEVAAQRAPGASFLLHDLRRGVHELPERGFDVCGLFDVIEHLDDAAAVLQEAATLVRGGGLVVGTAPAMMRLWSRIDEQSGHRVRYERPGLQQMLASVRGTQTMEVVSFNRVLVPMMWAQRKMVARLGRSESSQANLALPPRAINEGLVALLRLERRAQRWLDQARLPGASLWFALRVVPRGGVEPPT
jgi:2-polyprenyl-3-methyl-5-hydroxy-6-metoxy-1,4-benzoquinol methylase